MASGEYNRKHNKKIHRPCPVCGSRVIVANHGEIWWVACDADRTHIKQVYFHEPIDAIRWWNARTNADRIRAMSDEELANHIGFLIQDAYLVGVGERDGMKIYPQFSGHNETLEWLKKEVDDG